MNSENNSHFKYNNNFNNNNENNRYNVFTHKNYSKNGNHVRDKKNNKTYKIDKVKLPVEMCYHVTQVLNDIRESSFEFHGTLEFKGSLFQQPSLNDKQQTQQQPHQTQNKHFPVETIPSQPLNTGPQPNAVSAFRKSNLNSNFSLFKKKNSPEQKRVQKTPTIPILRSSRRINLLTGQPSFQERISLPILRPRTKQHEQSHDQPRIIKSSQRQPQIPHNQSQSKKSQKVGQPEIDQKSQQPQKPLEIISTINLKKNDIFLLDAKQIGTSYKYLLEHIIEKPEGECWFHKKTSYRGTPVRAGENNVEVKVYNHPTIECIRGDHLTWYCTTEQDKNLLLYPNVIKNYHIEYSNLDKDGNGIGFEIVKLCGKKKCLNPTHLYAESPKMKPSRKECHIAFPVRATLCHHYPSCIGKNISTTPTNDKRISGAPQLPNVPQSIPADSDYEGVHDE